jgi:hypothetical protein
MARLGLMMSTVKRVSVVGIHRFGVDWKQVLTVSKDRSIILCS